MSANEILRHLQIRPFVPFRMRLLNGEFYDVMHPELCIVGRTFVNVGLPDNAAEAIAARVATIALLHIAELIPLTPGMVA